MICRNRKGEEVTVFDNPGGLIQFLYDCAAGKVLLHFLICPGVSKFVGWLLNRRISCLLIKPFIKKSGIDMREYKKVPFKNYNEFFRREIKKESRIIEMDPQKLIAPCDGKLTVYSIHKDSHFQIKGCDYTMRALVRDQKLTKKYEGGSLLLFRLAVNDYHRYCYLADGTESKRRFIRGVYHTVNPYAAERMPIYKENSREYSLLRTKEFGDVLVMEVGAMMVGKIENHHKTGKVRRGEEKGYFEFGASSVIVCLEKGVAVPDEDLLKNTLEGYETIVKQGEVIGRSCLPL